jgi:hypothetical protein
MLVREQHDNLYKLAEVWPATVFYVFPFYITPVKLHQDVPNLAQDTWLLPVADIGNSTVFNGQRTKVVHCRPGLAVINPEYRLQNLSKASIEGVSAREFASWYQDVRKILWGPRDAETPGLYVGFRSPL